MKEADMQRLLKQLKERAKVAEDISRKVEKLAGKGPKTLDEQIRKAIEDGLEKCKTLEEKVRDSLRKISPAEEEEDE
jgi:hypothetical protein